ncbi:MAG TPA: tyrosine-protein phosphatase [Candidatus Fimiplasma intestinipullorum]|uniref:Tyrosine-protein phosphatase n=1 Tax=Candidatus Fimiplasma intestinipullorum TaxID=2840825 RepID=A0A9D1HME5_9FIRM|nr:tyrosine-protein phosphatase [Candidatus Fimiplasma intestinipullorum]
MMYLTREERLLNVESIKNTRDLGGYETQEGSFTHTHRYVRAATPAHLTERDKAYLYDYGVRCIVDLRSQYEIEKAPNQMRGYKDIEYFHVDIFGDPNATLVPQSGVSFKDMGDLYCLMLDHFQNSFRKVFQIFLEHLDICVLFHCSAGKDRTGVIAALLLDLAGCHMYDIVKDYSESYENNQEIYEELLKLANNENAHYLMSDPIYMMKMMDHLYEQYGSARGYLRVLGFQDEDIDALVHNLTI